MRPADGTVAWVLGGFTELTATPDCVPDAGGVVAWTISVAVGGVALEVAWEVPGAGAVVCPVAGVVAGVVAAGVVVVPVVAPPVVVLGSRHDRRGGRRLNRGGGCLGRRYSLGGNSRGRIRARVIRAHQK